MNASESLATIRRCVPADAAVLSALSKSTFFDTFTGTCSEADMDAFLDEYYNEARLEAELHDDDLPTYFAEIAGQPVGYLRLATGVPLFPAPPHRKALEVARLYVDTAWQGKGVAAQLMDFYFAEARRQEVDLLWLGVWEHNERAKAFYAKWGFTATEFGHPFPIGNTPQTDQWWMRWLD
jgi:ribosomal protein S18 acetylase RimI-like enzyme